MSKKKDFLEQWIREEIDQEAEEIKKLLAQSKREEMPADVKARISNNLQLQIEEYEKEKVYARLSEEDREALKLGKEMLQQKEREAKEPEKVVVVRKKRAKMYVALAAVLVLVLAMGITSVGGPKRVIQIMKSLVGEREVVQVDSDEDNYVIQNETEEQVYEKIKQVFGTEPVRITHRPDELEFTSFALDEKLQTAELYYKYRDENVAYFINAAYADSSLGIDVEDKVVDEYQIECQGEIIRVKEYELPEQKEKRYSANFSHKGLDYFLVGTMEKENFEKIVKNLLFY